jgi:hypothetical protein
MKKINKDPFSNGTEHILFEERCCNKCIKASQPRQDGSFTNAGDDNMPNKCAIQRDIVTRMYCDEPINERTVQICHDFIMKGTLRPFMKTKRKKYTKKDKNQLELL